MTKGAILFNQQYKVKRGFSPIYLGIFSGIILIILIINGILEIKRAQNGFFDLLKREGTVLIQHFEKNIQETLTALQWMENGPGKHPFNPPSPGLLFGIEDDIAEYLLEVIYQVDQLEKEKPLAPSDLRTLVDQYPIGTIEIYDAKGRMLKGSPSSLHAPEKELLLEELVKKRRPFALDLFGKPLSQDHVFSMAVWRRAAPGIITLTLNGEQMKRLLRQFGIQRAISDLGFREGIQYISVQDLSLTILAHTDPTWIGKKEVNPFLKNALHRKEVFSRHDLSSKGKKIFEVGKPFFLNEEAMGMIRIGYSPSEIETVLRQIKKNVFLSVLFFLILGVFATILIWVNQNRHLKKLKEMEDRIQLAERLSSLGHLAAGVAHEIRNPLNAMGMGLQRLKREFLPQEDSQKEEYRNFLELILKEIKRVNEIVEQFLTLSRPFELHWTESSLKELLETLVNLFREEASVLGITLRTEIAPDLPQIKMDPERLKQAFINIIKNGMQAMEPGGTLRLEAQSFKERVQVTITDSGSGIPPDQMEKIFNYYYTTKEKGVGLGLPIAHRIIEAHHGQLKIESQVGLGTKVIVTLPLGNRLGTKEGP